MTPDNVTSTSIYYFSGTGNSLAAAKGIADKTGGKLVSIASVIDCDAIDIKDEKIGIVFPVYNQGIPYIIKRFIEKAHGLQNKYIFSVCTCGGKPCLANKYLSRLIEQKGGALAGGFSVKMPYNYVSPVFKLKGFFSFTLKEISPEKQQEVFEVCKEKIGYIGKYVSGLKTGTIKTSSEWIEGLVDRLKLRDTLQKSSWLKIAGFKGHTDLPFLESIQLMDCGFSADENCKGCGTCGKICPVANIKFEGGRPVWQHKCEQCFACLQWCPNEAIQFGGNTAGRKRYHHPDVKLSDMLKQSGVKTACKRGINYE